MKKFSVLLAIVVFAFGTNVMAQEHTLSPNSGVLHAGVAFGGYSYSNASSLPAINISYDRLLGQGTGPGFLSVGAVVGYKSARRKYEAGGQNYKDKWSNLLVGARVLYHLDVVNRNKFNVYFGSIVGVRIFSYDYGGGGFDISRNSVSALVGGVAGAQYFFTNRIGAFAEVGYGIGFFNLGASIKL